MLPNLGCCCASRSSWNLLESNSYMCWNLALPIRVLPFLAEIDDQFLFSQDWRKWLAKRCQDAGGQKVLPSASWFSWSQRWLMDRPSVASWWPQVRSAHPLQISQSCSHEVLKKNDVLPLMAEILHYLEIRLVSLSLSLSSRVIYGMHINA